MNGAGEWWLGAGEARRPRLQDIAILINELLEPDEAWPTSRGGPREAGSGPTRRKTSKSDEK